MYVTISPVSTVKGFFVCVFTAVVLNPVRPVAKSSNACAVITGSLLSTCLATPVALLIPVMNFLNAKSNSFGISLTWIIFSSLKTFGAFCTITTGWFLCAIFADVDQYVISVVW